MACKPDPLPLEQFSLGGGPFGSTPIDTTTLGPVSEHANHIRQFPSRVTLYHQLMIVDWSPGRFYLGDPSDNCSIFSFSRRRVVLSYCCALSGPIISGILSIATNSGGKLFNWRLASLGEVTNESILILSGVGKCQPYLSQPNIGQHWLTLIELWISNAKTLDEVHQDSVWSKWAQGLPVECGCSSHLGTPYSDRSILTSVTQSDIASAIAGLEQIEEGERATEPDFYIESGSTVVVNRKTGSEYQITRYTLSHAKCDEWIVENFTSEDPVCGLAPSTEDPDSWPERPPGPITRIWGPSPWTENEDGDAEAVIDDPSPNWEAELPESHPCGKFRDLYSKAITLHNHPEVPCGISTTSYDCSRGSYIYQFYDEPGGPPTNCGERRSHRWLTVRIIPDPQRPGECKEVGHRIHYHSGAGIVSTGHSGKPPFQTNTEFEEFMYLNCAENPCGRWVMVIRMTRRKFLGNILKQVRVIKRSIVVETSIKPSLILKDGIPYVKYGNTELPLGYAASTWIFYEGRLEDVYCDE